MKLRILQALAWINVAFGALILCGGLFGSYAYFTSREADRPDYLGYFIIGISLCLGMAFLLSGRGFLTKKSQATAETAASGFGVLIWLMTGSLFEEVIPVHIGGPLPNFIAGILFAYACFVAIKRFVIKPCYQESPAI